jgi:hypothetical protein
MIEMRSLKLCIYRFNFILEEKRQYDWINGVRENCKQKKAAVKQVCSAKGGERLKALCISRRCSCVGAACIVRFQDSLSIILSHVVFPFVIIVYLPYAFFYSD